MWSEIPEDYKEGVDALVVRREAESDPEHAELYTMGMCFTEPYPSDYGGPETTRSILALYHGSFLKVAGSDPDFPWEEELWETITHELRHHLEFMADEDALEGVDYAVEECHKREQGEDFDPWYFQSGLPVGPGAYRVEGDLYLEQEWPEEQFQRADRLEFDWGGERWWVPKPGELGDLLASSTGSAVSENRIVSPIPSSRRVAIPATDLINPPGGGPASVTPRCNG